ncbi:MAG: benzoate 1,2-dioxygenase small subunit, partial [Rugosibacter sp.]
MPNNRLLLQHDIEQFLYREAQLLDNRDFEQWLDILA